MFNYRKLNKILDERKIKKSDLLRKIGLTRPALESILAGKDFRVSNLEKLANALNVTIGCLFDEDPDVVESPGKNIADGQAEGNGSRYNECDILKERLANMEHILQEKERMINVLMRINDLERSIDPTKTEAREN